MPGQRDISLAQVLFYSWEVIAMRELQFHIMWPFLRASRLISSHLLFPLIFKFPCTMGENIRILHIEIIHLIGGNITTVIVVIFTESTFELFNQLIPKWLFRCGEAACPEKRKPSVRIGGNRLIYCYVRRSRMYAIVPERDLVHKPLSWRYPFLDQDS